MVIFGHIIRNLSQIQRSRIRKIESTSKKIVNAEAAVKFNEIALKEDLLPNYTNIYIYMYIYIYIYRKNVNNF